MDQSAVESVQSAPGFDESLWEDLLVFIEEKCVIPVIGADLIQVECEGQQTPFYHWAAREVSSRLGLRPDPMPADYSLNDVMCAHLAAGGRREEVYPRLLAVVRKAEFAPPQPLIELASITDFNLFVSTTFDQFLQQAVDKARFGGEAHTEVLAYAPNRVDLPCEKDRLRRPMIFKLFGKLSAAPSYAVSDEDVLEFIWALQPEHHCPQQLFHELQTNHLLVLGCSFPDWLERFFLRMAKQRRLSDPRDVLEVVADSRTPRDPNLVFFLQHVSSRTKIFRTGDAGSFVTELYRRWTERQPVSTTKGASSTPEPRRFLPPEREMPPGAIFVSYTRKDLPAVQEMKAGLESAGLPVWFDMDRLEAGDDFDRKIHNNIARCSFFVPVVSAATESRLEGYFRREWNYALDRTQNMAEGAVFILPVVIDATEPRNAIVPQRFLKCHWTNLDKGVVTPEFARRLRELVGGATVDS